ncbi:MAG: aminopeptidase [Gaiellaceae bacterium]|nr:aminopeptidase [Gaiellaceae bacterium]
MSDPRVERLAELLLDYSLQLREGQTLRIDGFDVAEPLMVAVHRAAIRRGANAYAAVSLEGAEELLVAEGNDEQLVYKPAFTLEDFRRVDAVATIFSRGNTRSMTRLDADRQQRLLASTRELWNMFYDRVSAGEARWVGTMFPTHAHAQEAEMSLREYEQFVYGACHVLDGEDAATHWRERSAELSARARELEGARQIRIVGPGTDLRLDVEGRRWEAADGILNMPDGEVFTSPVETGTEGEIRFDFPAIFNGREVEDVRLRFEGGAVVAAEAGVGEEYLRSLVGMDEGSKLVGEFAFGLNYEIDRFTRNILFDEKIGGTVHVALGSAFKHLGGLNESGLHWDLICDLREEGEIYADGELVWRAGSFLRAPAPALDHV